MKMYYPIIFTKENTGYSTVAPDLSGCYSEGDTFDEAYENIKDAIGLYLEDFDEYPAASDSNRLPISENQFLCVVEFDHVAYERKHAAKSVKKTLTIPEWLSKEGVSEPDLKGRISDFVLLKYSQIRKYLLRFVPRTAKNSSLSNSATETVRNFG